MVLIDNIRCSALKTDADCIASNKAALTCTLESDCMEHRLRWWPFSNQVIPGALRPCLWARDFPSLCSFSSRGLVHIRFGVCPVVKFTESFQF